MPLVPAKCPECGASLRVNPDAKMLTCRYCGSDFIVEQAIINNTTIINNNNTINADTVIVDGFNLNEELKGARTMLVDLLLTAHKSGTDLLKINLDLAKEKYANIYKKVPNNLEASTMYSFLNRKINENRWSIFSELLEKSDASDTDLKNFLSAIFKYYWFDFNKDIKETDVFILNYISLEELSKLFYGSLQAITKIILDIQGYKYNGITYQERKDLLNEYRHRWDHMEMVAKSFDPSFKTPYEKEEEEEMLAKQASIDAKKNASVLNFNSNEHKNTSTERLVSNVNDAKPQVSTNSNSNTSDTHNKKIKMASIIFGSVFAVVLVIVVLLLILPLYEVKKNGIAFRKYNDTYYVINYTGKDSSVIIPEKVRGVEVTNIGIAAFDNCSSLTSITIPDGVTSIDKFAFSNCSSLTSIKIPNSVTNIGKAAFFNCSSLTSITIPNNITSIDEGAFSNCRSLTSITIPDGVTSIGSSAFYNCTSLTSITIPDGVTSIGYLAFGNCTNLTIYCEATSKPSGWSVAWNDPDCPVVWRSIPTFKALSYAEYIAAEKGAVVTVKGVVTAVIGKAKGNSSNCLYLQDADGAYYAYGLSEDPSTEGENQVKEGMEVRVTGTKDIYSGTLEVAKCSYEILNKEIATVPVADYTAAFTAAQSLKDEALVGKQGLLVTIKGVTLSVETEDDLASGYYKFKLGSLESYIRISSSVCPLTKDDQATFKASHKAGYTADATGIICVYDGAFCLTPVTADAFSNLQLPALSDAEAVAYEKGALLAPVTAVDEDKVVELQTAGLAYSEQVSISWSSDNACAVVAEDGKTVAFTLSKKAATVTLTATLKAGKTTDTVEFKVTVEAATADQYVAKKVATMAAGTYKFAMDLTGVGKGYLYATGTLNSKGALETTDKLAKAADFEVAAVEGKENTYTIKVGETYLVAYRNGSYNNMKLECYAGEWVFDATLGVFKATYSYDNYGTTKEITVYFGAYLNAKTGAIGNTMALSNVSYISGDNAAKVGVSQFPAYLYTVELVDEGE